MVELIYKEDVYAIQGAVYEVYREKGCGFLEPVYQECLEIELGLRNMTFVAQPDLRLQYKGRILRHTYKPDFICMDRIILEIKAMKDLANEHRAQLHNYLKATGLRLGLLINFGHYPKVQIDRIAN